MEELRGEGEGEGEGGGSRTGSRRSPFRCLPTSSTDFGTADAAAEVSAPSYNCYRPYPSASPSSSHILQARPPPEATQGDAEEIKAKIMSHPKYTDLIAAFVDCQKVGAPPEVAARLSSMVRQLALDPAAGSSHTPPPPDPELDQFMELYCDVLIKFREELTRPLQEAKDFLNEIESQLNLLPSDLLLSGVGSSDKDEDGDRGGEADPRNKELKQHLLKKYGSYLSGLRQELSKKKKKGKLPKDARRKLLNWWELHYKWPYPSEMEKVALAVSTGLDQKQINNWFINQRKRHWKPSEDMQLFVMDGYHPQTGTATATATAGLFSIDGQFMCVDGMYRFG